MENVHQNYRKMERKTAHIFNEIRKKRTIEFGACYIPLDPYPVAIFM